MDREISIHRAVVRPFPSFNHNGPLEYISREEKLETIISNLEKHRLDVQSDLLAQATAAKNELIEELANERASTVQKSTKSADSEALLRSLNAHWDSKKPRPIFKTDTQAKRYTSITPWQPERLHQALMSLTCQATETLDAYEKQSAKTLEMYYRARERLRNEPGAKDRSENSFAEFGAIGAGAGTAPAGRKVSYDASRDPRVRR